MRYMLMFKSDQDVVPPCQHLAAMESFTDELTKSGVLLGSEGLRPTASGARVTRSGGKLAVVDGPFAEAKELVAGFALVEVPSKAAAIELAGRFLEVAGEGSAEIRELFDPHA